MPLARRSLIAAVALVACNGSSGGTPAGTSFPTTCSSTPVAGASPAATCDQYLKALVARAQRCGDLTSDALLSGSEFAAYCTALLNAPGAAILTGQLAACLNKVPGIPCELSTSDVCECSSLTLRGTLPDGAACGTEAQCASGNCMGASNAIDVVSCGRCAPGVPVGSPCGGKSGRCAPGATCADGKCKNVITVQEGQSCASKGDDFYQCAPGLHCGSQRADGGTVQVCLAPAAEGAPCGSCSGSLRCIKGTCQKPGQAGAACQFSFDCASGFSCDSASHTCTATTVLTEGQACALANANSRCADGLHCTATTMAPGVCKAYKRKGEACGADDRCTLFTVCQGGTCVVIDPGVCH